MKDLTSESIGRREHASIRAAGFWAAVLALVGAIGYILSVPLQITSMLSPTQDAVVAFASSLAIAPSFLVAVVALHYTVLPEKRFWTHVAVHLASIYATLACVNYVVQLATVLPAEYSWTVTDQTGTPGPLSVLNQTPHSFMWDLDGLAYIFLNLSTLFAARAFERRGPQRVMRRVFLANAAITPLFAVAYFWPRFYVPILLLGGIPWSITVPASMLGLSIYFPRAPSGSVGRRDTRRRRHIGMVARQFVRARRIRRTAAMTGGEALLIARLLWPSANSRTTSSARSVRGTAVPGFPGIFPGYRDKCQYPA